jgi:hypothetical protein
MALAYLLDGTFGVLQGHHKKWGIRADKGSDLTEGGGLTKNGGK